MNDDIDLHDRVVIVTGASRGIGKGLALGLASRGARVVCAARTVEETPFGLPGTIHATVDAVKAAGGRAAGLQWDIAAEDDTTSPTPPSSNGTSRCG